MVTTTLNSTAVTTTTCGDQWFIGTSDGSYDSKLLSTTSTFTDTSGNWSIIEESPLEKQELLDYINFLHKFLGIPFSIEDWKKMNEKERSAILRDKSIDDVLDE